jgi:hypothetical protein
MMKKSSWIVKMECTVIKEVICDDCTREDAENNPWDYAIDETEIEQTGYDVLSVKENK